jgi:glycogenin glucosyltransferase
MNTHEQRKKVSVSSNLGVNACLCRLDPNMTDYQDIMEDLKNPDILSLIATYKWPGMQYLTLKYSGKWHNLDIRYASFNGYPNLICFMVLILLD